MNCNLVKPSKPDARLEREIARLDAIIYCCRRKYGDGGPYLFGSFSIVDAFMAPFLISLHSYGAQLAERSEEYMFALLVNPHSLCWLDDAQREHDKELYALTG
jgi:glutathione S-transferase